MFHLIPFFLLYYLMFELLRSFFVSLQGTHCFQKCFFCIIILIFLKVEFRPQWVELFLFQRKQFIDYLDDWIVVSERIGVLVAAELIRNENFTRMFDLQDKELLN